jgi:hypothetical protein
MTSCRSAATRAASRTSGAEALRDVLNRADDDLAPVLHRDFWRAPGRPPLRLVSRPES